MYILIRCIKVLIPAFIVGTGIIAVSSIIGLSAPSIHDEFSYLLAADTFLNGRVANPPHPMWEFLETYHVIQLPSYASKYLPGQGVFLAFGTLISGNPIAGVWLSMAMFASAAFWMFLAGTNWRYASLGVFLIATQFGLASYWAHSYWGGGVAALGGALVGGALFRLIKDDSPLHSMIMGVGFILLMMTRPYESMAVITVVFIVLCSRFLRTEDRWRFLLRGIAPLGVVGVAGAISLGYYNWQVTGSPFLLPYSLYESQYMATPAFLWQEYGSPPSYRHTAFEGFFGDWASSAYFSQQTFGGFFAEKLKWLREFWGFYIGLWLAIPLLLSFFYIQDVYIRVSLSVFGLVILATCGLTWSQAHYAAPASAFLYFAIIKAVELYRATSAGRGHIGDALIIVLLIGSFLHLGGLMIYEKDKADAQILRWSQSRQDKLEQLSGIDGKHLVVVEYSDRHSYHDEWVHNEADIDGAKVVWARSMGAEKNKRLFKYFSDRRIWWLDID